MTNLLFSARGSLDRKPFWLGTIAIVVLWFVAAIVEAATEGGSAATGGRIISTIVQLLALWISFNLAIKRCRALGRSPWWSLLLLAPVVNVVWYIAIGIITRTGDASVYHDAPTPPPAGVLEKLAGMVAIVWLVLLAGWMTADVFGRYLFGGFSLSMLANDALGDFNAASRVFGWATLVTALAGLLAVFAARAAAAGSAAPHHYASRLSIWPGIPLLLILLVLACAAVLLAGPEGFALKIQVIWRAFTQATASMVAPAVLLPVAATVALTRTRWSSAAIAAPLALLPLFALFTETSISRTLVAFVPLGVALASVAVVAAFVTGARRTGFAFFAGFIAVVAWGIMMLPGIFTPAEFIALSALALLVVAIFVQSGSGTGIVRAMGNSAMEVSGLVLCMVVTGLAMLILRLSAPGAMQAMGNAGPALFGGAAPVLLPLAGTLVVALIAWLATPAVAAIVFVPLFIALAQSGFDPVFTILMAATAAMAGMAARMMMDARRAGPEAGAPPPALFGAMALAALVTALGMSWLFPLATMFMRAAGL